MPRRPAIALALVALLALPLSAVGQAPVTAGFDPHAAPVTERLDLSGPDAAHPRPWRFRISAGARAGEEASIPVPSQWELQGFGTYAYGQQRGATAEEGRYALDFEVPSAWAGRRLELVFEGAMTDTEATLNGESVGPVHRGGFTRFSWDVTSLVRPGAVQRLEVTVRERSADRSVEAAERVADYWVFGGIYRPVHLDAHPPSSIEHLAIDARADGRLRAVIETMGAPAGAEVAARVLDADGRELARIVAPVDADGRVLVEGALARPETWSHERPVLHRLEATLRDADDRALHRVERRFGFRTVELRLDGEGPGLYVNGVRTLLRGVNRHSFWPDSGRALSAARNRADAELIRALHFNAVRASHYPPDVEFLDACDELGLYVIDELPGWHDAYDTEVGARLVAEMVRRDVNHPSILLWANGNEGGWNRALDARFAVHDPQARPVIHPWDDFGGLDTGHYPSWAELEARLNDAPRGRLPFPRVAPRSLVMPTEALHALFDGGGGASLAHYWQAISRARRGAGIFLWALLDEGVVRVDRGGEIDLFGTYAPDGILDPWRRAEPSAGAVREIFTPVRVSGPVASSSAAPGSLVVALENRSAHRSLAAATVAWRILRLPGPEAARPVVVELASGTLPGPAIGPGASGRLELPGTGAAGDALELVVSLPADGALPSLELARTVLPIGADRPAAAWTRSVFETRARARGGTASTGDADHADGELVLERGGTRLALDARSGELLRLEREGRVLPLRGGSRPADGRSPVLRAARRSERGDRTSVELAYHRGLRRATWSVDDQGAVHLSWMAIDQPHEPWAGIVFDYPRERVDGATWLGGGPFGVWANRLEGAGLGVWRAPEPATADRVAVPLEGARAGVRWLRLETRDGELVLAPRRAPGDPAAPGPFVSLYRPSFPLGARGARASLPDGIAVLARIPPIGSKFHRGTGLTPPRARERILRQGAVSIAWRPGPRGARERDPLGTRVTPTTLTPTTQGDTLGAQLDLTDPASPHAADGVPGSRRFPPSDHPVPR
ncbi:MAG TPA: glycoside hydrolase family 2 TIM barrel-domain containing protein [Thermoanaerobaculia bacterium]|nr:glycoside hydrolase family 2 TIM barrel-domain containing protein [Thermoanaerobaculia bacterium]